MTDGGGRAKRYVPVDPEEFIDRYRTRVDRALDGLRDELESIGADEPVGYIWNVHGRAPLLERTTHLVERAEQTLLISGWDEELGELAAAIAAAHRRRVQVAVIDYGTLPLEAAAVYPHPIKDTIHGEKGGRGLTLCADGRVALMGLVQDDGGAHGAWSRNRAFVAAAEDYLKHDIYVQKIVGRFHDLWSAPTGRISAAGATSSRIACSVRPERACAPQSSKEVLMLISIDGRLVPRADARVSVFDHGLLYGDGVFEGIRIYDRRIFRLDAHLARLEASAHAIRLALPMDRRTLASAVVDTVRANRQSRRLHPSGRDARRRSARARSDDLRPSVRDRHRGTARGLPAGALRLRDPCRDRGDPASGGGERRPAHQSRSTT